MRYRILLALFLTIAAPLTSWATISNVIIFGDSYSDIGDFPEASTTLINPLKPIDLTNLNGMVYVPVSNPVDTSARNINVHNFPVPNLSHDHLPPQPTLDGKIRGFRSLSWSEFLTADLYSLHKIITQNITPWISVETSKAKFAGISMSVNYAWASATTRLGCTYYGKFKTVPGDLCNAEGMINARQNYLKNPSEANLHKIIVPGMRTQVELFLQNLQAKKVAVNAHTDYVIEIGGNDFLAAAAHMKLINTREMADNVYSGAYRLLSSVHQGHLYIFTLFNPNLTPYSGEHRILGWLSEKYAKAYNQRLHQVVAQLNKQFPGQVSLVDEYQILQNIAAKSNPSYLQQACQLQPTFNCQGYEFWNAVHPSSGTEAIFGYEAAKDFTN